MIVYANYATEGRGRLEAEVLVSHGHGVVFLVPKENEKPRKYSAGGVAVNELNVQRYQGKSNVSYLLSYLTFLVMAFWACSRLFFQSRANVVHVHNMPNFLVFAGVVPRLFGGRLILDVHDTVLETYAVKFGTKSRLFSWLLRLEERISCGLAQKIICVNHVQREALVSRGVSPDKIATVISVPRFRAQKPAAGNGRAARPFRMVNHGTVSKRLGIDLIVQAVAKLVPDIPDFEFHLYGEGDDLEEVLRLAKSLHIENHVHFHGVIAWSKLPHELAEMDAGIVANRRNVATELMLPAKLLDYVVLGIPAIVPRLKGIEYYFSDEMVSYFEPEDVPSMVEAVRKLYLDKACREHQIAETQAFLEQHGWENQKRSLESLYSGL